LGLEANIALSIYWDAGISCFEGKLESKVS